MKQYDNRFAVVVLISLKEIIFYISCCLSFCVCKYTNFVFARSFVILPVTFWVLPKAGFLAQKLNRRTNVEPCTNAQLKPFSPAFGNTLLAVRAFVSLFNSTVVFIFLSIFCLFVELSKLFIKSC